MIVSAAFLAALYAGDDCRAVDYPVRPVMTRAELWDLGHPRRPARQTYQPDEFTEAEVDAYEREGDSPSAWRTYLTNETGGCAPADCDADDVGWTCTERPEGAEPIAFTCDGSRWIQQVGE